MSHRTISLLCLAGFLAVLVTTIVEGERPADNGAAPPVAIAAGANCGPFSYNRSIDAISVRPSSTGAMDVEVAYSMLVGDTAGAGADLGAEILLEVIIDDIVVSQATLPGLFDFLANDAVTCAVSCVSECGSIFGDGICSGCDCNYNRMATFPLATPLSPGHVVRATVLPLAGAAPELRTEDDVLEVTFGSPNPCCPWDFDGDNNVGTVDFLELLANWGPCSS